MKTRKAVATCAGVLIVTVALCVSVRSDERDKPEKKQAPNAFPAELEGRALEGQRPQTAILRAASTTRAPFVIYHAEFANAAACDAFNVERAYALVRYEKWADVMVSVIKDKQGNLQADPDVYNAMRAKVVWLEPGDVAQVPPPPPVLSGEKTRQLGESIVRGGVGGLKGKDVIIAVLDSGIDFHHPDFIDYDEEGKPTSRVLYFWDTFSETHLNGMGKPGPKKFPNDAPIGTLYSRADITKELRSTTPRIHAWDTQGHGTSCAGIAAGNGNAAQKIGKTNVNRVGVAPQADIIAVRLGQGQLAIEHSALLGAVCDWLEEVGNQAKKPIVLSCSFGGQNGGRDGNKIKERQLDGRFGPGSKHRWCRAICLAAGNDGSLPRHAAIKFSGKDAAGVLRWRILGEQRMSIYFDTAELDDIVIEQRGPLLGLDRLPVLKEEPDRVVHGITKKGIMNCTLAPLGKGLREGEMALYSRSGKSIRADAYMDGGLAAIFDAEPSKQIDSPGTATHAITVGSYDFNDAFDWLGQELSLPIRKGAVQSAMTIGALSAYSNPGPRRLDEDGVIKPDIAAPGQYYAAPAAINTDQYRRDTSGAYCEFNGTSAATPYTAGVVALMLCKNKNLTNAQIKKLLADHATKMDKEGNALDKRGWGNGKLDLNAVRKILDNVPES